MTKSEFIQQAQPIPVTIGTTPLVAIPKEFATGSVGYFVNGKIPVQIGGQTVLLQVSGSFAAIGSKDWSK